MSGKVNQIKAYHIKIDRGWKRILMFEKARTGMSIKDLVEIVLGQNYGLPESIAKADLVNKKK